MLSIYNFFMEPANILIVEDHALTLFALKTTLEHHGFVNKIYEANCAKDAIKTIENNPITLVIMDIGLPDVDGITATKKIKEEHPDIKVIILTSHCEKGEVQDCIKAKINAYCSKDIRPDKLTDVIKDVLQGSMYFDSSVAKYVMDVNSSMVSQNLSNDCYNLTRKEKKVLILLASGNNNSAIAKKLDVSVNTVKVHICSILQKLNVEDRTQAAIKAIRENLII